jgi:hypothetical protein
VKIFKVTKKTNAIFLTTLLVAGVIVLSSLSFMTGAQAFLMDNNYEQNYGMDNYDYKKPYGKNNSYPSKDSSNVKCNNINANVNGFNGVEVGTLPTALNGLATDEAQASDEDEIGASSAGSGSGRPSGHDNDSRFVCINNNNNVIVEREEPLTCEECFETFLTDAEIEQFGTSLAEVCLALSSEEISAEQFVSDLVAEVGVPLERANDLVECLIEAGIEFTTEVSG